MAARETSDGVAQVEMLARTGCQEMRSQERRCTPRKSRSNVVSSGWTTWAGYWQGANLK